ncbi:hypothetical protein DKG34_07250 [Streptomyces sp. NWU49]|nr:hypothetical protein DKG34_07250 [Streptomyces sp. NWU49]
MTGVPPEGSVPSAPPVSSVTFVTSALCAPGPGRGWVSQATAAPVSATGHSTTPATPSTPAPV